MDEHPPAPVPDGPTLAGLRAAVHDCRACDLYQGTTQPVMGEGTRRAPLMLVGAIKLAPALPVDRVFPFVHPDRSFMHLGFYIFDVGFQSLDSESAKPMVYTTTLLLITLIATLNLAAMWLRARLPPLRGRTMGDIFPVLRYSLRGRTASQLLAEEPEDVNWLVPGLLFWFGVVVG